MTIFTYRTMLLAGLLALAGAVPAQVQQLRFEPIVISAAGGQTLDFELRYATDPSATALTGLGLRLHWDSSRVSLDDFVPAVDQALLGASPAEDDTLDFDANPDTDRFIVVAWADPGSAWPGFADGVLALSRAFALAASSDEARGIREEVGFFQAIRAALVKTAGGAGTTGQDRELAIRQIVSRAVVSTEIVDILAAAGVQTPDISILSDEFLLEVQQMEKKNLGLEALRKLLNDSIRSRTRTNVVETRAFTERLEDAIARYHANAITTTEVLQELIKLAQDIRAARNRGEEQGLSDEEIAFYDALAENKSALQVMGDDKLRVIAHELLVSLRENVAVDWAHRESARARLRVLVKRILRKYGYPPDLEDAAVQTVLQQAEVLSASWQPGHARA